MHKFRFGPTQRKSLIVSVGMAAIMAVPALAQPLGLALASTDLVADASKVQAPALSITETNRTASLESLGDLGIALNRSGGEANATFTQYEASRSIAPMLALQFNNVTPYTAYITRDNVNFRSQPSTYSSIINVLDTNNKLTVTGESADWNRVIDHIGRTGYIWADYTSRNMVFASVSDTVYLLKSGVNLRQAPTTESAVLGVLSAGTRLTRTGIGDGWTRVRTAAGTVGYIASNFLATSSPVTAASSTSSTISKVVDTAYSMLGVPYVWAAESRSGVDCSGLILYCYQQVGITLPRTSASQATVGTAVSYSNMKPGDIIAMDANKYDGVTKVSHVGLYVGGGYMIHASSSNDKVVKANVANYLNYVKLITIRRVVN